MKESLINFQGNCHLDSLHNNVGFSQKFHILELCVAKIYIFFFYLCGYIMTGSVHHFTISVTG